MTITLESKFIKHSSSPASTINLRRFSIEVTDIIGEPSLKQNARCLTPIGSSAWSSNLSRDYGAKTKMLISSTNLLKNSEFSSNAKNEVRMMLKNLFKMLREILLLRSWRALTFWIWNMVRKVNIAMKLMVKMTIIVYQELSCKKLTTIAKLSYKTKMNPQ